MAVSTPRDFVFQDFSLDKLKNSNSVVNLDVAFPDGSVRDTIDFYLDDRVFSFIGDQNDFNITNDVRTTDGTVTRVVAYTIEEDTILSTFEIEDLQFPLPTILEAILTETMQDDKQIFRSIFSTPDDIDLGDGSDIFYGYAGGDTVTAGGGEDRIFGGGGKDVLKGQQANDILFGGGGDDRLFGNAGEDRLRGNAGNDRLDGGIMSDNLAGGGGNDVLIGRSGADKLFGGAGSDVLRGGSGSDRLVGQGQSDRLFGQNGDDVLRGGGGRDFINGGKGSDLLHGGGGADVFIFDRKSAAKDRDTIVDFDAGVDRIDLNTGDGFFDLNIFSQDSDTVVEHAEGTLILRNTSADEISSDDFLF